MLTCVLTTALTHLLTHSLTQAPTTLHLYVPPEIAYQQSVRRQYGDFYLTIMCCTKPSTWHGTVGSCLGSREAQHSHAKPNPNYQRLFGFWYCRTKGRQLTVRSLDCCSHALHCAGVCVCREGGMGKMPYLNVLLLLLHSIISYHQHIHESH